MQLREAALLEGSAGGGWSPKVDCLWTERILGREQVSQIFCFAQAEQSRLAFTVRFHLGGRGKEESFGEAHLEIKGVLQKRWGA